MLSVGLKGMQADHFREPHHISNSKSKRYSDSSLFIISNLKAFQTSKFEKKLISISIFRLAPSCFPPTSPPKHIIPKRFYPNSPPRWRMSRRCSPRSRRWRSSRLEPGSLGNVLAYLDLYFRDEAKANAMLALLREEGWESCEDSGNGVEREE